MGVAVLPSHRHHRRASLDSSPATTTPPPKPVRATRSSPPSKTRSGTKAPSPPSPAKPGSQARPGRKVRFSSEDSPPASRRVAGGGMVAKLPGRSLVMGEVTILKRGEDPKAVAVSAAAASAPAPAPTPATAPKPPSPPPAADRRSEEPSTADDVVFSSTERLGPEPEILPKQIRLTKSPGLGLKKKAAAAAAVYAGSGFIASPSPSCLPFPASFFNKDLVDKAEAATSAIKYLLRLDLA